MEHTETGPAALAAWLKDELTARDYNLSIRGGGRTQFAEDSGIGRATVSRILSGQGATDIRVLARLAGFLEKPLGDVLVTAGLVTADDLGDVQNPHPAAPRLTPETAADGLGFVDPIKRSVFLASVDALQRNPPRPAEKPAD